MTKGEIKAFWAGVAAIEKGKIKMGFGESDITGLDDVTEPEIDDILKLTLTSKYDISSFDLSNYN